MFVPPLAYAHNDQENHPRARPNPDRSQPVNCQISSQFSKQRYWKQITSWKYLKKSSPTALCSVYSKWDKMQGINWKLFNSATNSTIKPRWRIDNHERWTTHSSWLCPSVFTFSNLSRYTPNCSHALWLPITSSNKIFTTWECIKTEWRMRYLLILRQPYLKASTLKTTWLTMNKTTYTQTPKTGTLLKLTISSGRWPMKKLDHRTVICILSSNLPAIFVRKNIV